MSDTAPRSPLAVLREALWECYVLTGADTDGDSCFHCAFDEEAARRVVGAVRQLRADYDGCDIHPESWKTL